MLIGRTTMFMFKTISSLAVCSFAVLLGSSIAPRAEVVNIKADLTGAAEVPPTTSKGTGALKGTYDTASKKITWVVTYSGLTGPATAAHFHSPGPVGKAAPVAVPTPGADKNPIEGSATLT